VLQKTFFKKERRINYKKNPLCVLAKLKVISEHDDAFRELVTNMSKKCTELQKIKIIYIHNRENYLKNPSLLEF